MKLLTVDCSYISYQAFHSLQDLSHDGIASGVVFGFLNRVLSIGQKLQTNRFAFCWDSRKSYRREIFPEYKAHRREEKTPEEKERFEALFFQMRQLKTTVLKEIGFLNVFEQDGIESDDLMASISKTREEPEGIVIVTADGDLLQCINSKVSMYNPSSKKMWTPETFEAEYKIGADRWPDAKAISGCPGDGIPGVKGVGEKTAIKWLKGELKPESKKFKDITALPEAQKRLNDTLIRLPFHKTKPPAIVADKFDPAGLRVVADYYGMESFLDEDAQKRWINFFGGIFTGDSSSIGRRKHNSVAEKILERRRRKE